MPWIVSTTLTVFVPLVAVYWYVGSKVVNAVVRRFGKPRKTTARIVGGVSLFVNAFPLLFLMTYLLVGRTRISAFAGENVYVDLFLTYPFWFALVIVVQAFLLFVLMDTVRFLLWPLYRRVKQRWLDIQAAGVLVIVVFLSLYSVIVIAGDTWTVQIIERTVQLPAGARGLNGLTLVHISDVQGDGRTTPARLKKYVDLVNQQNPDLLMFSGDLVTSGEEYIDTTAGVMGLIRARYGRIAAVGDHDIFSDKEHTVRELRRNGFIIADDTTLSLWIDGTKLSVTLLTHTYRQRPEPGDLAKAVLGADGAMKILLVHQPAESLVSFAEEEGYQLFLAGHTHGGGIAFGIPGVFLISPARLESRFVSGFYDLAGMTVSVTNGIGMTLAPIRFHAPAQINVIRLVQKNEIPETP